MPLMNCPDCGKEISDAAISCPNCGLPRPMYELQSRARKQVEAEAEQERVTLMRWFFALSAFFALVALAFLAKGLSSPWTSAGLGFKGKLLFAALFTGGIAYWLFTWARLKQREGN